MVINKGGRPQKFNEDKLLEIVKEYINTEHDKEKPIKKTKMAKDLRDKGLNIVYQDLNRYKKIKNFIDKYNSQKETGVLEVSAEISKENTNSSKKNIGGRPRKFNEDDLLLAVQGYAKSFKRPELIKPTRVAKYFQDKGIKITYQDLSRYKKVNDFIQNYNNKYKQNLFAGVVEVDIEKQTPIFQHINTIEFLRRNKTPEAVEKALVILNQTNEKLVESYEKLQNTIILQNEKIILQSNEIEKLKAEIEILKFESKEREDKLKSQNKNIIIKARKMAIYEEFIHKYHYSSLAEYATNLEQECSNEHLSQLDGFFDKEKYLQGNFKLKDIAGKYAALSLAIDNIEHEYLKEDEYSVELSKTSEIHSNDLSKFINKEKEEDSKSDSVDEVKIDKLNLSIEDINSSLSFLD